MPCPLKCDLNILYRPEYAEITRLRASGAADICPGIFDLAYMPELNRGGILRPLVLPAEGGHTGYMDKIRLYEQLPNDLNAAVEGVEIRYHLNLDLEELKFPAVPLRRIARSQRIARIMEHQTDFPPSVHALVYTQAETGRRMLNFSPWFA